MGIEPTSQAWEAFALTKDGFTACPVEKQKQSPSKILGRRTYRTVAVTRTGHPARGGPARTERLKPPSCDTLRPARDEIAPMLAALLGDPLEPRGNARRSGQE
jgi:hypothetical protein